MYHNNNYNKFGVYDFLSPLETWNSRYSLFSYLSSGGNVVEIDFQ